jgi:hypothetical protein
MATVRLAPRIVFILRRFLTDRPLSAGSAGGFSTMAAWRPWVVEGWWTGEMEMDVEGIGSVSGVCCAPEASQI